MKVIGIGVVIAISRLASVAEREQLEGEIDQRGSRP